MYGFDIIKQSGQIRRHISLTGQFAAVDELLSGRENLWIIGALRYLPDSHQQAGKLLKLFRLTDAADEAEYLAGHTAVLPQGIIQLQFKNEPELKKAIGMVYWIGRHALCGRNSNL